MAERALDLKVRPIRAVPVEFGPVDNRCCCLRLLGIGSRPAQPQSDQRRKEDNSQAQQPLLEQPVDEDGTPMAD